VRDNKKYCFCVTNFSNLAAAARHYIRTVRAQTPALPCFLRVWSESAAPTFYGFAGLNFVLSKKAFGSKTVTDGATCCFQLFYRVMHIT
jgi:hypothetical protein